MTIKITHRDYACCHKPAIVDGNQLYTECTYNDCTVPKGDQRQYLIGLPVGTPGSTGNSFDHINVVNEAIEAYIPRTPEPAIDPELSDEDIAQGEVGMDVNKHNKNDKTYCCDDPWCTHITRP